MSEYFPSHPPGNADDLASWLYDELQRIADNMRAKQYIEGANLQILHAAPSKATEGDIVYADGADWNPGDGKGAYIYFNSTWNPLMSSDYWLEHAISIIAADYGDTVSVVSKNKDLIKFGRSDEVQTGTKTTLMILPSGTYNETYVASNLITTLSSDHTADAAPIVVEGHRLTSGAFQFVVQTSTLSGQSQITLGTTLARCTRLYNQGSTDLQGNVYAFENDTDTAGVPDTPAGVHCMIRAGQNQSEKASTTISNVDYWIVTGFRADVLEKTAAIADVSLEVRLQGKVFRQVANVSCSNNHAGMIEFKPYLIIPKNSDVRLRALASSSNTSVTGVIEGVLAIVV